MSKNESRSNQNKENQSGNIFYWIIGALTIILLSLIIFVFVRSGSRQEALEKDPESALVEEDNGSGSDQNELDDEAELDKNESPDEKDEIANNEEEEEEAEKVEEEEEDDDSIQPGESKVVNEDSPHDSSHVVNFNEGSKDRVAIKNKVMAATGLDNNLIEWWVGNNGPGKVETTVSDSKKKEIYKVYLQYGDDDWNVTNYERLDKLPE